MLFTTKEFFFLFVGTFVCYYLPFLRRLQVQILILASLIFYGWTNPLLLLLLIFSIGCNSVASYRVAFASGSRQRVGWATAGVAVNLGILLLFKYGGLLAHLVMQGMASGSADGVFNLIVQLPLPIGISFYTFEGISLVVDTLRRDRDVKSGLQSAWQVDPRFSTHLTQTSFFIAFFPHLIAGPVLKARSFFPQIGPKRYADIPWDSGLRSLLTGYFFKVVVADNLRDYTFWLTYPHFETRSTFDNVALLFAYSIQIFADFAGYSLIAIGLAALLGYELMQNFDFPYVARSLAEFWKRWHISLSTWLRDYLYFPLGGNRKGTLRTCINLMVVMTLGGMWHGASWSYAVWGVYHGMGLVVERLLGLNREPVAWTSRPLWMRLMGDSARVLVIFVFVSVGWIFFMLTDFGHAMSFFRTLPRNASYPPTLGLIVPALLYSLPVFFYCLPHFPTIAEGGLERFTRPVSRMWGAGRYAVYGAMLALLVLNPGRPVPFIYFQF